MTNNPPSAQIKPGEYGFPIKLKARYDNFIGGEWKPLPMVSITRT